MKWRSLIFTFATILASAGFLLLPNFLYAQWLTPNGSMVNSYLNLYYEDATCVMVTVPPSSGLVAFVPYSVQTTYSPPVEMNGVIYTISGGTAIRIATSTETAWPRSAVSSLEQPFRFSFELETATSTTYCIGVESPSVNTLQYFRIYFKQFTPWQTYCTIDTSTMVATCGTASAGVHLSLYAIPATMSTSSIEDMASTTEAIYTVGYSIQLYASIFLFLFLMLWFTWIFWPRWYEK